MAKITFIEPSGAKREVDAPVGASVMEAAMKNKIEGVIAECGGVCSCATCRVYIEDAWLERTGAPSEDEQGMIEYAGDDNPNVRLSCQIRLTDELDGLVVRVAEKQR